MKLKITKKFLLNLKDPTNRKVCSVRINNTLYDYAKGDAHKLGMSLVDYMNNLLLAKGIHDNEGNDIFACLNK